MASAMRCFSLAAAFAQEKIRQSLNSLKGRTISNHPPLPRLLDQTGGREKAEMMSKGGGWKIDAILDLTDREAFWTCAHQGQKNIQPRF